MEKDSEKKPAVDDDATTDPVANEGVGAGKAAVPPSRKGGTPVSPDYELWEAEAGGFSGPFSAPRRHVNPLPPAGEDWQSVGDELKRSGGMGQPARPGATIAPIGDDERPTGEVTAPPAKLAEIDSARVPGSPPVIAMRPPRPPLGLSAIVPRVTVKNEHIAGLPPLRSVGIRIVGGMRKASPRQEPWIKGGLTTGKEIAVTVDGTPEIFAFCMACRVTRIMDDLVMFEIACGPFTSEYAYLDFLHKMEATEHGERRKQLLRALVYVCERLPEIRPGIVIRFMGGPPMSEDDAGRHGYHFWQDGRTPVKAEVDLSGVPAAMAVVARNHARAFGSILVRWWWALFAPGRYADYEQMEAWSYAAEPPPVLSRRDMARLVAQIATIAGPAVASGGSIALGRAELQGENRERMSKAGVKQPAMTIFTQYGEGEELGEGDIEPLPDEIPKK